MDTLKLNLPEQEHTWSWWVGYNYALEAIPNASVKARATDQAAFWAGLADFAGKRSKQIKENRLKALLEQRRE